ncbi:hypothetical protein U1Q18_006798 [Sarracenia purpurea var. burkii]
MQSYDNDRHDRQSDPNILQDLRRHSDSRASSSSACVKAPQVGTPLPEKDAEKMKKGFEVHIVAQVRTQISENRNSLLFRRFLSSMFQPRHLR